MRAYGIWLELLLKRMLKKPAFILLLFSLPLLALLTEQTAQTGRGEGILVGVMIETESAEAFTVQDMHFLSRLQEQDGLLTFQRYEEREQLLQDIARGSLDCGIICPGDLEKRLLAGDWQGAITIYQPETFEMEGIVKERVAAVLFSLYSEDKYEDYVREAEAFEKVQQSGIMGDEIAQFAKAAYETRLSDGSTFAFQYHRDMQENEVVGEAVEEPAKQRESDGEAAEESVRQQESDGGAVEDSARQRESDDGAAESATVGTAVFRLRGVLAVGIFLSGLCGLLIDWEDRQDRKFTRLAPEWLTTMVNTWIPTVCTSFVTLICLCWEERPYGSVAEGILFLGKEGLRLLFYQFLIVLYCSIIRLILRKRETLAAAIPILTLASMVCCPIWIRLSLYLPVFGVLEKLFPATYYLLG
ncbi:MAG: hypothetical protein NC318_07820 [Blautia sp.]|nr:hypothetical protein [Lachnoclostridium sp.]MCM1211496.1 hypothetical protein [Blautia sp.]